MIQLRVYGEDGCEPKEEELMYIVHLVVVGGIFFGTVANVVEDERVEMTKHIGGLAMSSLYCSSSNQNSSHCREVSRLPGFFFVLLSAFYSGRVT